VSNTLTSLIPSIYAGLNVVAREMIGIIPAVTRNSGIPPRRPSPPPPSPRA
jgi:hypothetical protein